MKKFSKKKVNKILNEVKTLLIKKNEDYGSASFDLGLNGNMVHIYDKSMRYKNLIEKQNKGVDPNFESIEDTLKDLIGYSIIGLMMLNSEENI